MPVERLQKIIAAAGVASRRKAEELITSGRVQVNGTVVTELGTKADSETDHIRVDGKLLHGPERHTYIVLNKPKGYVTTVSDPENRPTVMDLVGGAKTRVYPVGRLDWASEGLLLLTNDGELANALMKASSNVPKVYVVKVAGQPDSGKIDKLRAGVSIAEKGGRRVRTAPAQIRMIKESDNPWFEVTIIEGRNRQVRKMFEEVGHHVEKIRRVQYGPLALDVPPGEFRSLTLEEVSRLKAAAAGKKMFGPPRAEVMPTVQPQERKPAASVADRSAEVKQQPGVKIQFSPRNTAPSDSSGRAPFRPAAKGSFQPRAKAPFRPSGATARGPQAKPPFRPRTDSGRPPTGKTEYRGGKGKPFAGRGKPRFQSADKGPYRGSARTPQEPRGENRDRPGTGRPRSSGAGYGRPDRRPGDRSPGDRRPADRGSARPPFRGRPGVARPGTRSGPAGGWKKPRPEASEGGAEFTRPESSRPFNKPSRPFNKFRSGPRASGRKPGGKPSGPRSGPRGPRR